MVDAARIIGQTDLERSFECAVYSCTASEDAQLTHTQTPYVHKLHVRACYRFATPSELDVIPRACIILYWPLRSPPRSSIVTATTGTTIAVHSPYHLKGVTARTQTMATFNAEEWAPGFDEFGRPCW